jgi:hypothetical protein
MARINGVFTDIRGKVGNTVFNYSHSKQILKTNYQPSGIASSSQVAQRLNFRSVIENLKVLNSSFLPTFYTRNTRKNLSNWQRLVSFARTSVGTPMTFENLQIIDGGVEPLYDVKADLNLVSNKIDLRWSGKSLSNGHPDDSVSLLIFNSSTMQLIEYSFFVCYRSDDLFSVPIPSSVPFTSLLFVLFVSRVDQVTNRVIDSSYNINTSITNYSLIMTFNDIGSSTSTLQAYDMGYNTILVDWGDGILRKISKTSESSSIIVPSFIKLYSRDGLDFFKSSNNDFVFDLADLPTGLSYFYCTGHNQISTYTAGKDWGNLMNYFHFYPFMVGLSSDEVDNLLIDLAKVPEWMYTKIIRLKGANAARTSASDAAVDSLWNDHGVYVDSN